MQRVGTVVGTAQGVVVVRSPDDAYPAVGTEVIDESLGSLGEVVDVFGPVDRPYVAVSPADEATAGLLGEPVYAR